MTRPILRYSLIVCLLAFTGFAAWSWLRPYAWHPDPAARCQVLETLLTRDQAFFWLNVHLKVNPGVTHDLQKPVHLATSDGKQFESADTMISGSDGQGTTDIWLKFWLDAADLTHPLTLQINEGKLRVKASEGVPNLGNSAYRNFTTDQW